MKRSMNAEVQDLRNPSIAEPLSDDQESSLQMVNPDLGVNRKRWKKLGIIPPPICTNSDHAFRSKVSKFKQILYDVLSMEEYASIVRWCQNREDQIEILSEKDFIEQVLVNHFGHNRMSSFQRHMHGCGFQEIIPPNQTSPKALVFRTPPHFKRSTSGLQRVFLKSSIDPSCLVAKSSPECLKPKDSNQNAAFPFHEIGTSIPMCSYCILQHIAAHMSTAERGILRQRNLLLSSSSYMPSFEIPINKTAKLALSMVAQANKQTSSSPVQKNAISP